jgi:hypothetical protein
MRTAADRCSTAPYEETVGRGRMSTVLQTPRVRKRRPPREAPPRGQEPRASPGRQLRWLFAGAVGAFAVPFVFADAIQLQRDLFYGVYAASVGLFVVAWARHTGLPGRELLARNWRWGLALGVLGAGLLVFTVLRTEDATEHPGGLGLVAAILWRGVVYGVTDGVLLSVFPILAVFAAFARTRLHERIAGKAVIGLAALAASMVMTATYHLGYSDFRSQELRKPIAGDVIWSAPTLLTLSPLGAPIAHAGLHVGAVVHSYETDTFLPPHAASEQGQR